MTTQLTNEPDIDALDKHLDAILRASGSALRHYSMQKTLDDMRAALRAAMAEAALRAQGEPVAWRELCRRLYVELFHCDQQMTHTLNDEDEPIWTTGSTVRDVLADAKARLAAPHPKGEEQ